MERTGLIKKLFRFADALVGWLPGGFAYATILCAVMFGAISGSSTAMAAAMGVVAFPEMVKRGYPTWMAAGIVATGGGIAILITPSITLILFGVLTEESIPKLFLAGVTPGIMLAISDAIIVLTLAQIVKLPAGEFRWAELKDAALHALPALMMPVIVLGGLYGGVLTPTESGAGACAYATIYGFFALRKEFFKEMLAATTRAVNLDRNRVFPVGWRWHLPVPAGKQGLAARHRAMGSGLRPVTARLPDVADGRAVADVHVPDGRRNPRPGGADYSSSLAVAWY